MTEQDGTPAMTSGSPAAATPAPASATVTFVFSDLEGSTRLLSAMRDGYAPLLEAYHDLIARIFEEHGGAQIDQAGDGLFYSFPSARRAVAAVSRAPPPRSGPQGARRAGRG